MQMTSVTSLETSIRKYGLRWLSLEQRRPGIWDCTFARKDSGLRFGKFKSLRTINLTTTDLTQLLQKKLLRPHKMSSQNSGTAWRVSKQ